ncbi:Permease, similar to cation transporter [Archaeoglobus sulfaticallidus PM70-1]|uniref:Permease, similar to cation transporter n=1 Tax=Archaeoglobus sulfaticallidus PM70-1 TaxID=387631 RepID=N0BIH8_9EURY|nr:magnesium transporter [Archaeoglobus sulfaticallidus]AGK60271.1 Permease, similar to cation transporter [Archaeoglobus sulfaticallidus PM70-1]
MITHPTNGSRLKEAILISFPFLIVCVVLDFFAGAFLGSFFDKIMNHYPIILVILPGLMGLRGNIFGAMANRFSTLLYLGEMEPRIRKNRRISSNIFLSLILSMLPVVILWAVGSLKVMDFSIAIVVFLIAISSTIFASLILAYSTALVTVIPFRKGTDPNSIAPPVITSIADLVTIPLLVGFMLLYEVSGITFYSLTLSAFMLFAYMLIAVKLGMDEKRALKEMITIIAGLAAISAISGGILESYSDVIYASTIFSVMYPAILDSSGNYGSIIGAKTSTMLHLGEIGKPLDRKIVYEILIYSMTGIPLAVIMNSLATLIVKVTLGKTVGLVPIFLLLYPIFLLFVMTIAHLIAIVSEKVGFDPDNTTVPVITTIADMIGTAFTVVMAFLLL